jgi:hypothetical protein
MPFDKAYRTIDLPSRGVLYDGLIPDGRVKCTIWDTTIEELFAGGGSSPTALVGEILERCLVDLPIPVNDLLIGDRYYAFFALRAESYGDEYEFPMRCSACKLQFRHTISIMNDLEVITLDDDCREPIEVILPHLGITVAYRFLRGRDEDDIDKHLDRIYKARAKGAKLGKGGQVPQSYKKGTDPSYKFRLAKHIVSIDSKDVDFDFALDWIGTLKSPDSLALRRSIDQNDPRIDIRLTIECPRCEYLNETFLPFTPELVSPR